MMWQQGYITVLIALATVVYVIVHYSSLFLYILSIYYRPCSSCIFCIIKTLHTVTYVKNKTSNN